MHSIARGLVVLRTKIPKEFKKVLVYLYLFGILLGLVLTLLYAFIPTLVACSSIFGENFCTPTGLFLILTLSIPGYLIVGNIMAFFPEVPWGISLVLVVLTTGFLYYLIGKVVDRLLTKKVSLSLINTIVVYGAFGLLVFFLLALLQGLKE